VLNILSLNLVYNNTFIKYLFLFFRDKSQRGTNGIINGEHETKRTISKHSGKWNLSTTAYYLFQLLQGTSNENIILT